MLYIQVLLKDFPSIFVENTNIKGYSMISYSFSGILYKVVTFELWMTCGSFAGSHESVNKYCLLWCDSNGYNGMRVCPNMICIMFCVFFTYKAKNEEEIE